MPSRSKLVRIPLPIRGLNTEQGVTLDLESLHARELTNYFFKAGKLQMRPASRSSAYSAALGTNPVAWYDAATSGAGFEAILFSGIIRTVSTGAGAGTIGAAVQTWATTVTHAGTAGSLSLVIGCREPRNAAAPFAVAGPTPASFATTAVYCACSHKGRLYYANSGTLVDYTNVGVVAGAMPNATDFAQFLSGQSITRMFSVTVNPTATTENAFVVIGSGGRVLIFAGDHPNAANWSLIGRYDMPKPGSPVSFAEVDGDIFVATTEYAYWVRDLITGGAQAAYENSPTRPIQSLWRSLRWDAGVASTTNVAYCAYIPALDVILCGSSAANGFETLWNYAGVGAAPQILAYSKNLKAWSLWASTPFRWPVIPVNNDELIAAYGTGIVPEIVRLAPKSTRDSYSAGGTTYEVQIETSLKTPYISAFDGVTNKVNAVRIWFENTNPNGADIYKVRSIFDYSDFNSLFGWFGQSTAVGAQTPSNYGEASESLPVNTAYQYHPMLGASGQGGGFSVQISQRGSSTDVTHVQSVYAATAYVSEGGESF